MRALAVAIVLFGCKVDTSVNEKRAEEFKAAFRAHQEPYMKTLDAFLDATSHKDFERAYGWLAPSYTNMVTKQQFAAAIATNKNFGRQVALDGARTRLSGVSMTIPGSFGDLGRAEITFMDTPAGPRISGV